MCCYHIYERYVAHVMRIIFGATKGPCKTLYIKLHKLWPQIYLEVNKLENIVKFLFSLDAFRPGTMLHQLAVGRLLHNALKGNISK
jgi:hypothetical protein